METAGSGRYYGLDALRGSMMLLGVWLHTVVGYSRNGGWPYKDPRPTDLYDITLGIIHAFRMPAFYVMAGFFGALLYTRRGRGGFLDNRMHRVLLPFVGAWVVLYPLVLTMAGAPLRIWWERLHPLHLWFLEYLVMLYGLAVVVVEFSPRWVQEGAHRVHRWIASRPLAPVWIAPLTMGVLWLTPHGELPDVRGFTPEWLVLVAYAIPFGFGWLLYGNRDLLEGFARRCGWYLMAAVAMIPVAHEVLGRLTGAQRVEANAVIVGLFMWLMIYGLTGAFLRYGNRPSEVTRYLSDSSYFVYLIHMPVLMTLQIGLRGVAWPTEWKVPVVLVTAIPLMLAMYHWCARDTWIGQALNGRRYPRSRQELSGVPSFSGG